MAIVQMTSAQASAVAQLHRESIKVGLIAELGQHFCEMLYCAIAKSPYSFVLVYEGEQHQPLGFICCTTNTSKMYRNVMLRHFFPLLLSAMARFFRPPVVKQALSALQRPKTFKTGDFAEWELPEAEVFSMAVTPDAQGKGIGTKLIQAAFERLRKLGQDKVRVWTIIEKEQATEFYKKRGFKLLGVRQHHSGGIYVLVADLNKQDETTS